MEGTKGPVDAAQARESAERFWHISRGLEAAFFLAFAVFVFILAYRQVTYDVRLDAFLGSQIAERGFAGLAEAPAAAEAPTAGWLWWLLAHGIYRVFGVAGVRVFAALMVAAGFSVMLVALSRRVNLVVAGILLVAAAHIARIYIAPGPHAAGIFVFAALAALIINSLETQGRRIWWAVPLMVFYVNIDLSWPAGAALCLAGIAAAGLSKIDSRAQTAAALAVALLATILNPDFLQAWQSVGALPVPAWSVEAWIWPAAGEAVAGRTAGYMMLLAGGLLAFFSRSLRAFVLAGAGALVALAGLSVLSFAVFAMAAAAACASGVPGVSRSLAGWLDRNDRADISSYLAGLFTVREEPQEENSEKLDDVEYWTRMRTMSGLSGLLAAVGLVVVLVLASGGMATVYRDADPVPEGAVSFIVENAITGRLLVQPAWAGYLSSRAAATEPLATTRPLAARRDAAVLTAWAFGGAPWPADKERGPMETAEAMDLSAVLAPVDWARALAFKRAWTPVYWDDFAAVLAAPIPQNAEIIEAYDSTLTYPPFLLQVLAEHNADKVAARLIDRIEQDGDLALAHYGLAVIRYQQERFAEVAGHLAMVLAERPSFIPALSLMGDVARIRGEDSVAMRHYARVLEHEPQNAIIMVHLANLQLKQGDWVRALRNFRAAQAADDRTGQLDAIRPGLRAELDEQVERMVTPRPPEMPDPDEPAEGSATESTDDHGDQVRQQEDSRAPAGGH